MESVKRLIFLLALGAVGAFGFRAFLFEGIYIASDSMAPTLTKGRHVFVNKTKLWLGEPQRGDVVMFRTPQYPDKGLVKRVVAIGGDVIEIRRKKVFLNGALLDEPYAEHRQGNIRLVGDYIKPLEIPKGYVFVMGDNRDYSRDSRDWKNPDGEWSPYVPLSSIEGIITP